MIERPFSSEDQLCRHGYSLIARALPPARIAALHQDLQPHLDAADYCIGGFYGERTKRVGGLLNRSPIVAEMVLHPHILALVRAALGPFCDTIQLNLTQAIAIHPGAPAQFPHRDEDMWRGETGRIEYLVNVIWPVTTFSEQNGATVIWPGSHGPAERGAMPQTPPISAGAEPGDALVFLGSTLHGGGANQSALPRMGVIVSYCLGWLKPYENQWLVYPPAVARGFSPALQRLIGYQQHRPNLGNVEGQCPSLLLGEGLGASAVDALRPDQEEALAHFLDRQAANGADDAGDG